MINFKIHFDELKLKIYYLFFSLFFSFFTSYFFAPNLINILSHPFLKFATTDDSDFIFTSIFEVFTTYYTLSLYSCFFFNVPLALYFTFSFFKSGLFRYERNLFLVSFKLFVYSAFFSSLFVYYIIFPLLLLFLLSLDLITDTNFLFIKMETKIYEYITFLCKSFIFYCFFLSQIPVVFFTFLYFKKPAFKYIVGRRKFWILFCLTIGCVLSSPDLFSLVALSTPLVLSFEMFVFFLILKYNYKYI